jgi:hypothetical protein
MARLVDRLNSHLETPIRLVKGADDVCASCPHLDRGACKRFGEQVEEFDDKVITKLGYRIGDTQSWSKLLDDLSTAIPADRLADYCGECRWLDLNYCYKGLKSLAARRERPTLND